jgi:hypothetical protein
MDANGNVCFSENITKNYYVSSNVGSFSSPSTTAFPQSPTVNTVSPTVSYGGSVKDVCALASAPHLCSAIQDCGFSSAIASGEKSVEEEEEEKERWNLMFLSLSFRKFDKILPS